MLDVVLILDSSGSIQWERMKYVRNFSIEVVNQFYIATDATRVGAVYFSTSATVAFTLDQYSTKQDIVQALQSIPFIGDRTNLADAQRMARTGILGGAGNRADAWNLVIIMTDGKANIEVNQTIPENILLKNVDRAKTVVITVSVGAPGFVDFNMLNILASAPAYRHILSTTKFSWLYNLTYPVVEATCNENNECLSSPCQNGGNCSDGFDSYYCECQSPYRGYNCERQCGTQLDVVFVLDLSGSIGDANEYQTVTNFTREVVAGLSSTTRIGVVTFDTTAQSVFYLNTYSSRRQLLNAINFYAPGGTTNAQAALNEARTDQYISGNGDRSGVQNVVIYVSDGKSDVLEGSSSSANAAEMLKNSGEGVLIYTVGMTDSPNTSELSNISTAPNSTYNYFINASNDYEMAANELLDTLCA
jgi:Mg-chelatase subunit ChlD